MGLLTQTYIPLCVCLIQVRKNIKHLKYRLFLGDDFRGVDTVVTGWGRSISSFSNETIDASDILQVRCYCKALCMIDNAKAVISQTDGWEKVTCV